MNHLRKCLVFFASMLLLFGPGLIEAQAVSSPVQTVNLSMNINESVTLSVTGGPVSFTYASNATVPGSAPLTVTTGWSTMGTETAIATCSYISGANVLTGPANVPANKLHGLVAWVSGSTITGVANNGGFPPGTGTLTFDGSQAGNGDCSGTSANSITVFLHSIAACPSLCSPTTTTTFPTGSSVETLTLSLDTTGTTAPGAYSGVLNFIAIAA